MQYRSREDIVAAILDIAKDSVIRTRIMYRALLSYPQLVSYLNLLLDNNLLEHNTSDNTYRTTKRGIQFLDMYYALDKMIPKENMLTQSPELQR